MTAAAIYARVSSARQAKDETIGSQLSALRDHAASSRPEVPGDWVFADEGHSGATLARPALQALRDLAAQGCPDVVLVYSPDRLARKFACQALLIEELARCGVRAELVKGPRGDSPEDQLLIQFQGMFAGYQKAQLAERHRRGKAWRARTGSVNVLSGAPFGYCYVRKTPQSGARYEVVPREAALVAEMFGRYAGDGAAIADLGRWLTAEGARTRTGKERWDRPVIWGMLRNPAYAGTAVFGKTQAVHEPAGLNRTARLAGRTVPRQVRVQDRPREEWTGIPVPALVDEETFDRVRQRLADNKRFASRNTKVPSLLQGLAACASCGYGYYRSRPQGRSLPRPQHGPARHCHPTYSIRECQTPVKGCSHGDDAIPRLPRRGLRAACERGLLGRARSVCAELPGMDRRRSRDPCRPRVPAQSGRDAGGEVARPVASRGPPRRPAGGARSRLPRPDRRVRQPPTG